MQAAPRNDQALRAQVAQRLRDFSVQALPSAAHRAAVALAIGDEGHGADLPGLPRFAAWSDRAALLLTRRAQGMRRHAGQWALPGGRVDAGESAVDAALREAREEIGLELAPEAILGWLDDYPTR